MSGLPTPWLAPLALVMTACAASAPGYPPAAGVPAVREALPPPVEQSALQGPSPKAFAYVVVSVGDMQQALALWVDRFGMEIARRARGDDPELARLWGLPPGAIDEQVLLNTPGMIDGGLHLVRFAHPGAAVREGAAATDLVPKSIDIGVRDIEARHAELAAAGYHFRSPVGRLETDGTVVHEVHMSAHDGLNLAFVEQAADPEVVSPRGYGVAPRIVLVTADDERELDFFRRLLALDTLSRHHFAGPEVERTIGLPPGAGLDVSILGDARSRYGRLEFVQCEGVRGRDLYPRTAPPARGMLSVTYVVEDLGPILERGAPLGLRAHGRVRTVLGEGRMASVTSPAGLRVDIIEL